MEKKALGRGLNTIFSKDTLLSIETLDERKEIRVDLVIPNRNQPRRRFSQPEIDELVESIKHNGILQPVLVRETPDEKFELIAGERRWRAASLAGLQTIPAMVKQVSDHEVMELALIENIQRSDLTVIEVARAYQRLIREFSLTQDQLSTRVGKTRSSVANVMRLLTLPHDVQEFVESGSLTLGHAKVLLSLANVDEQQAWAKRVVQEKLSVRDLEGLLQANPKQVHREKRTQSKDPNVANVEAQLKRRLGTKVKLTTGSKGGRISIDYYSLEDLERILEVILR
tara:strand:- start:296 stop:1147 length:852 start_codon:yes stop_codon:yes gene_type:complete